MPPLLLLSEHTELSSVSAMFFLPLCSHLQLIYIAKFAHVEFECVDGVSIVSFTFLSSVCACMEICVCVWVCVYTLMLLTQVWSAERRSYSLSTSSL